ncbi:adhesion G protein-coupled receptor F5-like [Discoglossus pictus]
MALVTPDALQNYIADIEISYSDPLLQSEIRSFLENTNIFTAEPSSITVTSSKVASVCSINESLATCNCQDGFECAATSAPLSSCSGSACDCNVSFPAEQYCREVRNMTLSPENPYVGDTLNIVCQFPEPVASITWYHNNEKTESDSRHNEIISLKGTVVSYTLTIKDLQMKDAGTYTCKISEKSYEQSTSVSIRSLNINQSKNVDIVCDGTNFTLTCCSGESSSFNVNWTITGDLNINGTALSNSTCNMYIVQANETQCPGSKSGSVTRYTCEFQGKYGVKNSSTIAVTYIRRAKVEIIKVQPVSVKQPLKITCRSDVTNIDKFEWRKDNMNNVIYTERGQVENGFPVSHQETNSANMEWAGVYYCAVYQRSINTTASVTVEVVALPSRESIQVDPLVISVKCSTTQTLNCCFGVSSASDFVVTFNSDYLQAPLRGTPSPNGKSTCYTTSLAVSCDEPSISSISITCNVTNKLNNYTISNSMVLNPWRDNVLSKRCLKNVTEGLQETPSEGIVKVPCSQFNESKTGYITYTCKNGEWTKENDCSSVAIFNQYQQIQDLLSGPQAQNQLPNFIKELSSVAKNEIDSISTSPKDISLMVSILSTVANETTTVKKDTMSYFINTVDVVVNNTETWKTVGDSSSSILGSVETFASKLQITDPFETDPYNTNIQLKGRTLNTTESYEQNFNFSKLSGTVKIGNGLLDGNSTTVVSIAYTTMKDILKSNKSKVVNSLVMSTVVHGDLNTDFVISMLFSKNNDTLENPECVYWDFNIGQNGEWNNKSCNVTENANTVICTCNHLTSFSVLMGGKSKEWLDWITYIGVGISIASLVLTLIIEAVVWRSVIKNKTSYLRHVCLVNIAVTLLAADIWFIIGAFLERHPESDSCLTAAFFSFYFYLSLFFWMLTNGLILFYRLIYILHDMSRKTMMIIAFTLGYACPLLIVIITVAVTAPDKGFTNGNYCWLNFNPVEKQVKTTRSFLAFVIPSLTIVCINFIILLVVIIKLLRPSVGERPGKDEKVILMQVFKSVAVLTPLLGITWGFGLAVTSSPEIEAFNIIFTVLNSFQGFFILISTVLLDQKVRRIMGNTISSLSTLRNKTTSTLSSTGPSVPKKQKMFKTKGTYNFFSAPRSSNNTSSESYSVIS